MLKNKLDFESIFNIYHTDYFPQGLLKALIVPRPIAWVSTVSKNGVHNLAPYSYFNLVCDNPPTVMISTTNQHVENGPKDTIQNIEDSGHFVINTVTYELYEQMNMTSADFARNIDEFENVGIEWLTSQYGGARRVAKSPIQLECKYFSSVELPKGDQRLVNKMVIATVVGIHVDNRLLDSNNKVNYEKLGLIARMGYHDYIVINKDALFEVKRPS